MREQHEPLAGKLESEEFSIEKSPFFYTTNKRDLLSEFISEDDGKKVVKLRGQIKEKIRKHHRSVLESGSLEKIEKEIEIYTNNCAYVLEKGNERTEDIVLLIKELKKELGIRMKEIKAHDENGAAKTPEETKVRRLPINSDGKGIHENFGSLENAFQQVKRGELQPAETPTPTPHQPKRKVEVAHQEEAEQFTATNFDELADFLTVKLPQRKAKIEDKEGSDMFDRSVEILEQTSKNAKEAGGEVLLNQIKSVNDLQANLLEQLKPGSLKNRNAKALMQNIYTELSKLRDALIRESKKIAKPEKAKTKPAVDPDTTKEETAATMKNFREMRIFFEAEFSSLNIKTEDSEHILRDVTGILEEQFELVQKEGEQQLRDFGDAVLRLNDQLMHLEKQETDHGKIGLIKNIYQKITLTLNRIDKELEAKTSKPAEALLPEKKEGVQSEITNIDNIARFVRKELNTLPEDQIKIKSQQITKTLVKEFEKLTIDSIPRIKILEGKTMEILRALEGSESKFAGEIADALQHFLSAILRKLPGAKQAEVVAPTVEATPIVDKIETPTPIVAPVESRKRSIESMIDSTDLDSLNSVPDSIKKDVEFNSWIERMADKEYEGSAKKLEAWYDIFTEQKVKIDTIKNILEDSSVSEKLFKNFSTKEDKEFAKKRQVEEFEFALLTDPEEERKIDEIIKTYTLTRGIKGQIGHLEASAKSLLNTAATSGKHSAEVVFDIIHGPQAEVKKIDDLADFLTDMSLNYEHYSGSIKNDETRDGMSNMFALYNKTRKNPEDHIGKLKPRQKFWAKFRDFFAPKGIADYDDSMTFRGKILALRNAGLVETARVSKDTAADNMFRLKNFISNLQNEVRNGKKVQEAAAESTDEKGKELFQKIYSQYIESVADNSRMQEKVKHSNIRNTTIGTMNEEATELKKVLEVNENELVGVIGGDDWAEFEAMVNQEMAGGKLELLGQKLGQPNIDRKTLDSLTSEFEKVDRDHVDSLTYKKVALQLSQAEVRAVANTKDTAAISRSVQHYENIFSDNTVTNQEKIKYIDAALSLLKEKRVSQTRIEQLSTDRIITYFENKKVIFQK
ncbi:MAG: hypothetical protein V4686_02130 [Patescibacteria group bacterium]